MPRKNPRVYLHEFIDIIGHNRANYFEHMTVGFRKSAAERKQKTFGVWGTFGSTRRWPEVVNLWEYDSWEHMAWVAAHETGGHAMQDPSLFEWWKKAQEYRRSGVDRLLIPTDYSPSIDETIAMGVVGWKVYYHEMIRIAPGQARTYLSMVEQEWMPVANDLGMTCVGAYRTAMRNDDEVFMIWAIREWDTWATVEMAYEDDPKVAAWRARTRSIALSWENFLMCSAPQSPTQTGRQP